IIITVARQCVGQEGSESMKCDFERLPPSCHVISAAARCLQPMSEGGCSDFALFWYFHAGSAECRPFVYGGCGGTQNRFSSRRECQSLCEIDRKTRGNQSDHVGNIPSHI
uniref:BPTI/Kunitz inhibitor domain-containing protein n=1 Tax=Salarias fasciatus TaxID=181472 RepID=A0A672H160_SALFA